MAAPSLALSPSPHAGVAVSCAYPPRSLSPTGGPRTRCLLQSRFLFSTSSGHLSRSVKFCERTPPRRISWRCSSGNGEGGEEKKDGKSITTAVEEPKGEPQTSSPESSKSDNDPSSSQIPTENPFFSNISTVQLDSSAVRQLLEPDKVDPEDVKLFKERAFGYTTFWLTGQENFGDFGEGILFLGNLRGNREAIYSRLLEILKELFQNKYDLFMVEEPNATEEDARGGPRVSFVMLRKEISNGPPTYAWQYVIAFLLAVITGGACLELGLASQVLKLPPEIVNYFTSPDIDTLDPPDVDKLTPFVESALPLAYGVFGIQAFHEVGHRLVAFRNKVALGIPFLIPNVTIGSFGGVTQFKSPCPTRSSKFDIAVSGPLAGGLLSATMFGLGLLLTVDPNTPANDLVQVPSLVFQGSLLLGAASRAVLGYSAMHASTVSIHPLIIAGWCGLTTTALNLMPVGRIDGGRAMQAAFGKRALNVSSIISYFSLGLGLLGGALSLPWGLFILIVERTPEKPCLNDVTEVGKWRQGLMVALLIFMVSILLPIWDGLAEELGIGLGMTSL